MTEPDDEKTTRSSNHLLGLAELVAKEKTLLTIPVRTRVWF